MQHKSFNDGDIEHFKSTPVQKSQRFELIIGGIPKKRFGYRCEDTLLIESAGKSTWIGTLELNESNANNTVVVPVLFRYARGLLGIIPLKKISVDGVFLETETIYYLSNKTNGNNLSREKLLDEIKFSYRNLNQIYVTNKKINGLTYKRLKLPIADRKLKATRKLLTENIENFDVCRWHALTIIELNNCIDSTHITLITPLSILVKSIAITTSYKALFSLGLISRDELMVRSQSIKDYVLYYLNKTNYPEDEINYCIIELSLIMDLGE